jgi:hypothetical protein
MMFELLELQDKKQVRLASRDCNGIAPPLCCKTVTIEISGASTGHLNHIASNKTFAEHVRTLVQLGEMEMDD